MPKVKNPIIQNKKDYFYVALGIAVCIFCIILIGRVGLAGQILFLFFSFIFGDYATIILALIFIYSLVYIVFKKKFDFHHISFLGTIFIFLAILIFTHLGIYDALGMKTTNVVAKTLELYRHYLHNYRVSYSCGGGIIGALLLQFTCLLVGKIGSILVGIAFILIGISYFANMKFLKILKGGKFSKISKQLLASGKNYIRNLHFPKISQNDKVKRLSLSLLEDTEVQVNFALQTELNKEKFENLKRYVQNNRLYCAVDSYYTSYSSSRFIVKFANYSDSDLQKLLAFFNRQGFVIKTGNEFYIDFPNQFRKLLTLKNLLLTTQKSSNLPLGIEVCGTALEYDLTSGKMLVLVGDMSSGIKTFLRTFLVSLLLKDIMFSDVYFYDFYGDFRILDDSDIRYVNNERSASIALDEAFNEYERRSEVLKYFNCETISEANEQIKKANTDIDRIYPQIHILNFDLQTVSDELLQKITYAIRFSLKVGISIIIVARSKNELFKLELNRADIVAFNLSDVSTSLKLFGSDMLCRLQKKGDVIIRKDGTIYHCQTPYISLSDFEKIIIR